MNNQIVKALNSMSELVYLLIVDIKNQTNIELNPKIIEFLEKVENIKEVK